MVSVLSLNYVEHCDLMNFCHQIYCIDSKVRQANFNLKVAHATMTSFHANFNLIDALRAKIQQSVCDSMTGSFAAPFKSACQLIVSITLKVSFSIKFSLQIAKDALKMAIVVGGSQVKNPAGSNYKVCFIC